MKITIRLSRFIALLNVLIWIHVSIRVWHRVVSTYRPTLWPLESIILPSDTLYIALGWTCDIFVRKLLVQFAPLVKGKILEFQVVTKVCKLVQLTKSQRTARLHDESALMNELNSEAPNFGISAVLRVDVIYEQFIQLIYISSIERGKVENGHGKRSVPYLLDIRQSSMRLNEQYSHFRLIAYPAMPGSPLEP